jgi:hypothetical protein
MNQTELKNYFREKLVALRTIAQEYDVLDAIVDFITQAITTGIPDWTNLLTFNLDGSGAGSFCTEPDTDGNIRFWKTKTNGNIANQPPTNPLTIENTYWIEVSPSDGSAIKEWAAGIYGSGLVIVYHNHSTAGRGFYLLVEPVRPFNSTNIETEFTGGKWARFVNKLSTVLAAGNDAGAQQIKNLADPILAQDAATKAYVDAAALAIVTSWKAPVKVATTANITLSGTQTIDGISVVADDRVLVKAQTTQTQNGIYLCKSGAWVRAVDADAAAELEGVAVTVQRGTVNENTTWIQTTDGITLGSSNILWSQLGTSVPDASETVKGIVEEATDAEVTAGTGAGGTGARLYVNPTKLLTWWATLDASETVKGRAEIATQAETDTGTDDTRMVTPLKLRNYAAAIVDLGNLSGAVIIDLSTGRNFKCAFTGNVTSFTFTSEKLGAVYYLDITRVTTNYTIAFTAAKFRFPLGQAPILTNPATNGVGTAIDTLVFKCSVTGKLDVVITPDLQPN